VTAVVPKVNVTSVGDEAEAHDFAIFVRDLLRGHHSGTWNLAPKMKKHGRQEFQEFLGDSDDVANFLAMYLMLSTPKHSDIAARAERFTKDGKPALGNARHFTQTEVQKLVRRVQDFLSAVHRVEPDNFRTEGLSSLIDGGLGGNEKAYGSPSDRLVQFARSQSMFLEDATVARFFGCELTPDGSVIPAL
jgi:hypothetical protein